MSPSSKPIIQTQEDLSLTARMRQRNASNPGNSVWVGASAGSGKTTVLVGRLLRLMLPGNDHPATDPSKILCITFTKAGASEVMERVIKILREWAIADDDILNKQLNDLLGQQPSVDQTTQARQLFARILDTPGGMKIMTIHAFCQSVLGRFPLEAGLSSGFQVMEEPETQTLMRKIRHDMIIQNKTNSLDQTLQKAFLFLSRIQTAEALEDLLKTVFSERTRLKKLVAQYDDIDALCADIDQILGLPANANAHDLIHQFIKNIDQSSLKHLASQLQNDNATNAKIASETLNFIENLDENDYPNYKKCFLTAKNEARKPNGILKKDDMLARIYENEAMRIINLENTLSNLRNAECTRALLRVSIHALNAYEMEKKKQGRLDFEDLIERTKTLLSDDQIAWVHYKLDHGIDHILVDEAQDTNPDQWDIITSLTAQYYDGQGTHETMQPTSFVVGDEKQSIFSFQRADPRVFEQQFQSLKSRARDHFQKVDMQISFRSAPSILEFVDHVFAAPDMHRGVVQDPDETIEHTAFKSHMAGHVELWPLIKSDDQKQDIDPWKPFESDGNKINPIDTLSEKIADKISDWLENKAILESHGRPIQPGDILILLSKRKPFAESILRALRLKNIPVSGIDRMVVSKQMAVVDVLSALSFALNPDDDLNLASLLKSPLIGLDEEALLALCWDRKSTLWQALKSVPSHNAIRDWLTQLIEMGSNVNADTILHHILYTACPTDELSGMRALCQRLGDDARDPLQELLARADQAAFKKSSGLLGFVQDLKKDASELKRQMDDDGQKVRLMTVHGSKGLEAPIVFMPDTIRTKQARDNVERFIWPERNQARGDDGPPLWSPNEDARGNLFKARYTGKKERSTEEYKRLLYVGLTRAANQLYISGAQTCKDGNLDDQSWYFMCQKGFEHLGEQARNIDDVYILSNPQTQTVAPTEPLPANTNAQNIIIPAWAVTLAPEPVMPPKPLMPSKPDNTNDQDVPSLSPLSGDQNNRFKRGNIIHTLFQFLPDLPANEREEAARLWLSRPVHKLNADQQNEICQATLNVLNDKKYDQLFGSNAKAEIPLTGQLIRDDGTCHIVSAQIDRLVITDDEITIIDFKTNRPGPSEIENVPNAYKQQLRIYRDLVAQIYPNTPIRCVLLWTDGPHLMDLTESI